MLRDAVRGVAVVAAELAEETGKRVVGAATGLLERSGVDVAAIERTVGQQFPPSAKSLQTLAEEAVTAGRAGLDLAVGVMRSEVEAVFERVGDQVVKVGVVLGYLESKLREVEEPAARPEPRADGLFDAGWEDGDRAGRSVVSERVEVEVEEPAPAKKATAKKATAKKSTTEKPAARKATTKKTAPTKAAAKKTTVKTAAKKATAKKAAPAKKAAAGRKSAPRKGSDD
ncbi:hypothetical protein GCM10010193_17310 [Kitasatospora atroaurantiaca]|uniref:Histone H1-like nucleoprotein HC2 n=1 Tax=Kitasatospora atroaurantiaca TaxID=285545 RepID=A0A561EX75_9ACTN|nr:hypothetical protein [Kitasatospora atroaurantiaca]TWE20215.1 hypothetical protein FB465_5360 [Kitasatospora atroaurantiaca]